MPIFQCKHRDSNGQNVHWDGVWEVLSTETNVHELRVNARGSSFTLILGYCSSGNYLCIPQINVGCALGYWSDVFWNTEQLSEFLSDVDAITIATAINHYGGYH